MLAADVVTIKSIPEFFDLGLRRDPYGGVLVGPLLAVVEGNQLVDLQLAAPICLGLDSQRAV